MIYARAASGYRPGGPNPAAAALGIRETFAPDTTRNYELGIKGNALDRAISYDLSAYRINWSDIQLSLIDPSNGLGYNINAGRAKSQGIELSGEFTGFTDQPRYADAKAIAHRVAELYTNEEVDRVVVVYNAFESALVQRVTVQQLLPLSEDLLETGDAEREEDAARGDFIFEPEPEQILERLLPVYVETELYRALLESAASEHGARMTAMRNASKNAGELIDDLTLAMNRARQAEITQEILEVVGGADALSG